MSPALDQAASPTGMDHWQTRPNYQAQLAEDYTPRSHGRQPPELTPSYEDSSSYLTQPPTSQGGQHTIQGPSPLQQRRNTLGGSLYDDLYYDRSMTHPQTRGWVSSSKSHFTYPFSRRTSEAALTLNFARRVEHSTSTILKAALLVHREPLLLILFLEFPEKTTNMSPRGFAKSIWAKLSNFRVRILTFDKTDLP